MAELPPDFDLKFLPDWLKEPPSKNPFAHFKGEEPERERDHRQGRAPRATRGPGDRHEKRAPRREHGKSVRPPQRQERAPAADSAPPPVSIELLPDPAGVAAISTQIKAGYRAYPLFGLARMFLEKPERHRLKISSTDANTPLHQLGENGAVALDRRVLETGAFRFAKQQFYAEETTQGDPPKGNFSNVARCRLSGTLLGPTNHHGYQPALRKLYEERFSRRMSFPEYQREIDIDTRPEAVEAWKEQARTTTTYKTLHETEPLTFATASEAEEHFRKSYLGGMLRSGASFEISGTLGRQLPDGRLVAAVRRAWENERRFPAQLMHHLSRAFVESGLHIFRHRKRMLFVSAIRPRRFAGSSETLSPSVARILKTIEATPKCTRVELGHKMLRPDQPDAEAQKAALATDLHYLIHAGHVIEFHDGILDLPLAPTPPQQKPRPAAVPDQVMAQEQ